MTITDANLVLGRLLPDYFPKLLVFWKMKVWIKIQLGGTNFRNFRENKNNFGRKKFIQKIREIKVCTYL